MVRRIFLLGILCVLIVNYVISLIWPPIWWTMAFWGPIIIVGFADMLQTKKAIRRNFPIIGNFRYMMEKIRPEINQYFVESNTSGRPFSREDRSVVYQRAKGELDTVPFGTQKDIYTPGYEWVNHSTVPVQVHHETMRTLIGNDQCRQPYDASLLNISAMSYGALSKNAILALNQGASMGRFAHNTGEGGISPYHLQGGGDLIWQIGTGYFGCRTKEGAFCDTMFADNAGITNVKMIEVKLSQGAKPGGGGILPGKKVSEEIAKIRGVEVGQTIHSPAAHSTFKTPVGLLEFLARLRDLSNGKPVGFKLCVGKRHEFLAICKAMVKTGIIPDFISVDGAEGGTGAAPLEFSNYIGYPLTEGLTFVHNALVGFGLRKQIKILASGKVTTGFGMVHRLALGADAIYSARGMMLALGCIQALRCNSNSCPAGIATQDPGLNVGLVVENKNKRVFNYHEATIKSLSQIIGAMGLKHPSELRPWHIMRRMDHANVQHYYRIFEYLKYGDLLHEPASNEYKEAWRAASPDTFARVS